MLKENGEVSYPCYDCGKELEVKGEEIIGGQMLKYDLGEEWGYIIKCDECYEKDPSLRNYNKTEVYSRIVGYYRPVKQWNEGKQKEFKDRKIYNLDKALNKEI
jgi:hypothetical protein